jgi:hypothetical protein
MAALWSLCRRDCVLSHEQLGSVEADMEKIVLLCLLIATIGVLAEMSPAPKPQR